MIIRGALVNPCRANRVWFLCDAWLICAFCDALALSLTPLAVDFVVLFTICPRGWTLRSNYFKLPPASELQQVQPASPQGRARRWFEFAQYAKHIPEWSEQKRGRSGRIHKFNLGWNSILRRLHRCFFFANCIYIDGCPRRFRQRNKFPWAHKNFNCQRGSKQLIHV